MKSPIFGSKTTSWEYELNNIQIRVFAITPPKKLHQSLPSP
ncbi:hypothetical protein NSP_12640 [Nodularia spumigena CCY9414]|nr:hypothetical protein NSP_12640 [Nodularia spumigena CCY9414]